MAQSNVYSLNIVGYVNVPIAAGVGIYANPLDKDGTNSASSVLNLTPLGQTGSPGLDGFWLYKWTGSGFDPFYYESDYPGTGWDKDGLGNPPGVAAPIIAPGTGFFMSTTLGAFTNTFVGNVKPGPGATNSITVPAGIGLISSMLPVSGSITNSSFQFPLVPLGQTGNPGLDGFWIYKWTGSGYDPNYYESDYPGSGWDKDGLGNPPGTVPPSINLGEGFFTSTTLGAYPWTQTLAP